MQENIAFEKVFNNPPIKELFSMNEHAQVANKCKVWDLLELQPNFIVLKICSLPLKIPVFIYMLTKQRLYVHNQYK